MRTIKIGKYTFTQEKENKLPLYYKNKEVELWEEDERWGILADLLKENGYIIDEYYFFKEEDLEPFERIKKYYGSQYDGTTTFYKIKNSNLFVVQPADDGRYYVWEDKKEMIRENATIEQIFQQGEEETKRLFKELEGVRTVVRNTNIEDEECYFLLKNSTGLTEYNPAYEFEKIGITKEDDLILFIQNNCDVKETDLPEGQELEKEVLINGEITVKNPYDLVIMLEFYKQYATKEEVRRIDNTLKRINAPL